MEFKQKASKLVACWVSIGNPEFCCLNSNKSWSYLTKVRANIPLTEKLKINIFYEQNVAILNKSCTINIIDRKIENLYFVHEKNVAILNKILSLPRSKIEYKHLTLP